MAIAKVIEISAASKESFEDAIRKGIERATKTIDDVEGAWVKEQKVVVESGKVVEFRVHMQVTFVMKE